MPVPSNFVSQYSLSQGRQVSIRFTYANATDRQNDVRVDGPASMAAEALGANDLGSISHQLDDDSFYFLSATGPLVWIQLANTTVGSLDFVAIKASVGSITKGQAVYIAGWDNGLNIPTIELAKADSAATMPMLGLATETITDLAVGNVRAIGVLSNVDTSTFTTGDLLFVSATTAGALQNTRPTGATSLIQSAVTVGRSDASLGTIAIDGARRVEEAPNLGQNNLLTGDSNGRPVEISRGGADTDAYHDNIAGEFTGTTSGTLAPSDTFVWEDADDSDNKKSAPIQQIIDLTNADIGLPPLNKSGMQPGFTTVATLTISAGNARSDDDAFDIVLASPQIVDITASGANGLDTGVEAASTWYAVWIIGDSTLVNATATLLSASFTTPTLPVTHDKKRLIGAVRNDSGSDFLTYRIDGDRYDLTYWYDENRDVTPQRVLSGGGASAFTSVDCAEILPPIDVEGIFSAEQASLSVTARIRANGETDASGSTIVRPDNSMRTRIFVTDQTIQYQAIGGGGLLDVDVVGFRMLV